MINTNLDVRLKTFIQGIGTNDFYSYNIHL